jgi:hypothetical protein
MRRGLVQLLITDKKTNILRRRLNLLASLATYAIGNDDGAIGGEPGDFFVELFVLSRQPTGGSIRAPHPRQLVLVQI